jgi:hypothetical protein
MRTLFIGLALLGTTTTTARADLVIKDAWPVATATAPPSLPAAAVTNTLPGHDQPAPKPESAAPRFKMAYGFGDRVPLGFACRQIVPGAVTVTYGPGAGPQQVVTWKGGDTWNHVLRDAVKPLGLHLVMTYMAVEIRQ